MESSAKSTRAQNRLVSPEGEGPSPTVAAPKPKSKFGAFRTSLKEVGQRVGGRGKVTEGDPEAASTASSAPKDKDKEKKKAKKIKEKLKREKSSKSVKREGSTEESSVTDGSETATSPTKVSRPSKASELVRRLSIGKYRAGEGKPSKSPASDTSASTSRPAPEGEDGSTLATPPTPTARQPQPLTHPAADQSRDTTPSPAARPVTYTVDVADRSTPQQTPAPASPAQPALLEAKVWDLQLESLAASVVPLQETEPVSKDAVPEAEPTTADGEDPRAPPPPPVASDAATVRDDATSPAHTAASEGGGSEPQIAHGLHQLTERDPQPARQPEAEVAQPEDGEPAVLPKSEEARLGEHNSGAAPQRLEQQESAAPGPELEAAEQKPQPVVQDLSAERSQQDVAPTPEDTETVASDSEGEDMSQRRNRKRQGLAVAEPVGSSPGAEGLMDASLPSLKAELATADGDASAELLGTERADGALPNGTDEGESALGGDGVHSEGAASIGEAIAEARSKLTESLGAAAAAASAAAQQAPAPAAQQPPEKREHLYKILVIGELGTGKTSIIKRYVHQFFSQHYRATIGVDFALKVLNWDSNTIIRLQMWDIAGQERFGNMTRVYYKEAVGAFIVFDVTRVGTFDAVLKWKQDLDSKVTLPDGSPIPCVLLANKCDQQKEGLVNNSTKMDEYCKEKGFSAWYETSAKENINIDEAARSLVKKILQNDQLINQSDAAKDTEKINLDGKANESKSGRCSC